MAKTQNAVLFSLFALIAMIIQFSATEARAQSSYFTSQGCSGCHSAPVVATCNGCHAHGTHPTSAKSSINVAGTTNKASYTPGETVTVTMTGGYRTGWFRAVLLDQNNVELTRSTGNDSGMGSSATYPATLSAPAPVTAGTYAWKVAWYGNQYDKSGGAFGASWTPDATNPNHGYEIVSITTPFTVAAVQAADTTAPAVTAFTLPATATSMTIAVSAFSASDNVAVTGYLITTTATKPAANAAGWSATAPTSVTAPAAGSNTFYAWAKDAAGNVSAAASATVTITMPDMTAPMVSSFMMPATSNSMTIAVSAFGASDNTAVTGYMITTTATKPAANAAGWSATAPTSVTAPAAGSNTFYAWAKDAAGNVSAAASATVLVSLPVTDSTAPTVTVFTLPATSNSMTVAVSGFSASDNTAVTGYMITTTATAPTANAAGWTVTAPTSVTAAAGSNTFYAWAKDAAGNVSVAANATVTVTIDPSLFSLTVSTLADGSYTNNNILNISGSVVDNVPLKSFLINNKPAEVASNGTFSSALTLKNGKNVIKIVATDTANSVKTDIRTIYLDTKAPKIKVTHPADNSITGQSFVEISGNINENAEVSFSVNSGSQQSAAITGKQFSATVNLEPGANTIDVLATDLAGNSAHAKRTIVYDNVAPSIAITDPAEDMSTDQKHLTLSGTISDALSNVKATITVNDKKSALPIHNGVFQRKLTFSTAMDYAVTVTATDEAGNTSSVQRNILYAPPVPAEDSAKEND